MRSFAVLFSPWGKQREGCDGVLQVEEEGRQYQDEGKAAPMDISLEESPAPTWTNKEGSGLE
jgi:hypothetical protein